MVIDKLFSKKYTPIFRLIIQTLLIFVLAIFPFALNVLRTPPPYSITNYGPGGYSIFNQRLQEGGFNTSRLLLSTEPLLEIPRSSVLIIGGGSETYRQAEVQTLKSFVLLGGTLLLLAHSIETRRLASEFNVSLSSNNLIETEHYYKTPEIITVPSPFPGISLESKYSRLAFFQPKAITNFIMGDLSLTVKTNKTAFIDSNGDKRWSQLSEDLRKYNVAIVSNVGLGVLMVVSTPSFLCNDYYYAGFSNINITVAMIKLYSQFLLNGSIGSVYFEESHKRWPLWSRDGLINETYGTIILLSKTESFIVLITFLIVALYYLTPRLKHLRKQKETYKHFLEKNILTEDRDLYDTFGRAIKPTEEESMLTSLYFQYENFPKKVLNIYLQNKLSYIDKNKMTEKELELFDQIIRRELDFRLFISLFKKLEEIQNRRWHYNER